MLIGNYVNWDLKKKKTNWWEGQINCSQPESRLSSCRVHVILWQTHTYSHWLSGYPVLCTKHPHNCCRESLGCFVHCLQIKLSARMEEKFIKFCEARTWLSGWIVSFVALNFHQMVRWKVGAMPDEVLDIHGARWLLKCYIINDLWTA